MTDEHGRAPQTDDLVATVARLQDQIDDLTAVLESHQQLFEALRAAGALPGEGGL